MVDTATLTRHSNSFKTLLIENDAVTIPASNVYEEVISPFNCEEFERFTIQFRNADSDAMTAQVWGSLHTAPAALGTAATPASSYSISTTGLRKLTIRMKNAGSGTYALPAGNVLVHCSGTI